MPVSFHFISLSNRCSAQHSAAQQNRVNVQLLIQQEHIRQLARLERAVIVLTADSARRIGGRGTNRLTHLHYEVWINQQAVNPLTAKLPRTEGLTGSDRREFLAQAKEIVPQLRFD